MLEDEFMLPLVRVARMGLADPRVVAAGWAEYRGDVLLDDIQREKQLDRDEAAAELAEWVERHRGQLRTETQTSRRSAGSLFPTAASGGTSLVVLLPDDEIPSD
jgi:hypothetical protein